MKPATIFALASGGGAAVAVIRISGPGAGPALRAFSGPLPAPRHARLSKLKDPESQEILDRGVVLWFPGPASLTGEDVAELHVHGGRAVIAGVLSALSRIEGFRQAEPGEFTRRAFLNGKLDLTAAEAIADLVAAETEAQRKQALRQLGGEFGRLVESWRAAVLGALAHAEAGIDFAEDDPAVTGGAWRAVPGKVAGEIAGHLADNRRGERLRDGLRIAILGPANAGKSSLLNKLAGREAAIVSAQAGTTRDVIEVHLDLAGYPVILADTAGLREFGGESGDAIEGEGIRRALAQAEEADLRLVVIDAAATGDIDSLTKRMIGTDTIVVANKRDLLPDAAKSVSNLKALLAGSGKRAVVAVSAKTGEGLSELLDLLAQAARERFMVNAGAGPAITRARHREALEMCLSALRRFEGAKDGELAAEDLRLAAQALGRITGRVNVDDILDVIFRDFCIGK